MWRVVWSEPARTDLEQIRAYIALFNPAAAQRLAARIVGVIDTLVGQFSRAGRAIGNGRYEVATMPPYVIRYRVIGQTVQIIRVRHGARLP